MLFSQGLSAHASSLGRQAIDQLAGKVPAGDAALWASADVVVPFSFTYDGKPSGQLLTEWETALTTEALEHGGMRLVRTWDDTVSGLRVTWEAIQYHDFPALEWIVWFEATGEHDTAIIENVQALDLTLNAPLQGKAGVAYQLERMLGTRGVTGQVREMFMPVTVNFSQDIHAQVYQAAVTSETLHTSGGASSHEHFPFFKLHTGLGDVIVGLGWTSSWQSQMALLDAESLSLKAGMVKTHFRLHPGEKVRMPRMLVLAAGTEDGDSSSLFRRLIYTHYTPRRNGEPIQPPVYCNTCFTGGGGWLGDANNETNQASLIHAYGKLGAEFMVTDAGWHEGVGSYLGRLGNWQMVRKDNYPNGIAPLASAAAEHGMLYGLWMAIEYVAEGTWIYENHPEWLIDHGVVGMENRRYALLNFGLPEVQDWAFEMLSVYMRQPGFGVFRIDWGGLGLGTQEMCQLSDAPDRQGITEIRFVTGLYSFLERIHEAFPHAWLEGCASGGNRIDLETVRLFHIHQKSDYWFEHEYDQSLQWAFNQFLPGNTIAMHLRDMDDYAFHSVLGGALSLGWKADQPDFDSVRARERIETYKRLRHLTLGDWYPLLPYAKSLIDSTSGDVWMASQYDRRELGEGMLVVLRRPGSQYHTATLRLRGLDPKARYELDYTVAGSKATLDGASLMQGLDVTLDQPRSSELILYRRLP